MAVFEDGFLSGSIQITAIDVLERIRSRQENGIP